MYNQKATKQDIKPTKYKVDLTFRAFCLELHLDEIQIYSLLFAKLKVQLTPH